ncbi:hypothetical protein DS742_18205 [Lacrimispora amygdalina]|uniref:PcfJ-like protein n=2 Tax=Lacrimispora amygdalina TaxID=253257 RepID=A0A3E2N921_9FIRM|nr:hypothetical protein DS742_18205 [Clostridium indicum]
MMKMAADDTPKREVYSYGWSGQQHTREIYQYGLYMRCQTLQGILKVAFFLPDRMRLGGNLPAYEVFVCRNTGEFLTYDRNRDKWLTAKLDMLDWPSYVRDAKKKWINPEGFATIKNYLGIKHGGYTGLLEYQLQVRKDELKRRHKRETDPWDLDLAQTPELPKDWDRWVRKVGIPENYIFYQYSRKGADSGYCTYCEKEVPIRNPRHNKQGHCSCCRHEITFKSVGKAGRVNTKSAYMYLIQRCEDGFMIREFSGSAHYSKGEYEKPEYSYRENRRVIYGRNGHGLHAYYWGDYKHTEFRWISCGLCSTSGWYDYAGRVYGRTLPDLGKHELCRTGLIEGIRDMQMIDPEKYLAVLREVPQLEQLSKAGLSDLVRECMADKYSFQACFCKHGTGDLAKVLGTDAQGLKRLRANKGGKKFLKWIQYEKSTGKLLPDKVIAWFCSQSVKVDDLKFILDRMSIVQVYNYMRRQMQENRMSSKEMLTTWEDYLSMALRFDIDTNDAIIFRARKLRQRHDELVARCHQKKDLILRAGEVLKEYPHIEKIYQSISDIYVFADKDYTVVVPCRIEDIILEGENLHHCLGNVERYWERIESRESYVLFLRLTSEPEKSYYTLEIEPDGTVRQKRTMYDRQKADIEEAKKFLKKWQKEISKRLTDEERELAKTSRVLRNQEFAQLREDQVIIHTGHLCGHLLVDVLMADLMEATENVPVPALSAAA